MGREGSRRYSRRFLVGDVHPTLLFLSRSRIIRLALFLLQTAFTTDDRSWGCSEIVGYDLSQVWGWRRWEVGKEGERGSYVKNEARRRGRQGPWHNPFHAKVTGFYSPLSFPSPTYPTQEPTSWEPASLLASISVCC